MKPENFDINTSSIDEKLDEEDINLPQESIVDKYKKL